ncbi:MAG: GNAT family N-acetyltransferase [Aquaticitalea sp.]
MLIRKAALQDTNAIALLFMMVMDSMVYRFIGEHDVQKGTDFFKRFIAEDDNQYSYKNCYVLLIEDEIVGVINVYDGSKLQELRQPILTYIHEHTNPTFSIEDETQPGEYYIDVIAVTNKYQGKGIGSNLLKYVIDKFCLNDKKTIGLLVDKKNPNAKKLYMRMGFVKVGEKTLTGHEMEHLQFKI